MFMRSILSVFFISAFFVNAAVLVERKQDAATEALQLKNLKDSGLLDTLPGTWAELRKLSANKVLAEIVKTDTFKEARTRAAEAHRAGKHKHGKNFKVKSDNAHQVKETGLLNKLKDMGDDKIQSKINRMNGKQILIKIAQSQTFKTISFRQKEAKKKEEERLKGKKPTVLKIVRKKKGKPTATIISIKGGPAITLAAKGTRTTFAGKAYTVRPTPASRGKKNSATPALASSSPLGMFAKLFAVIGGAFGGMLLVL